MSKIKVAIGGIHFPLSMMSYFIRAFKRREDVECWLFGPFTGDYTPWNYGMHLPQKYVVTPDFQLPAMMARTIIPSAIINQNMPWTPDLTLLIDAGWHTSDRPAGKVVGVVQTDPHVLKGDYKLPKSYADITWCMQAAYIEQDEEYLPYAHDPTVHYPMDLPKEYDACLIGLQYPQRNDLVARLRSKGLVVNYEIGKIYDEYRETYNRSRIALSWSTLADTPARVFEAFGMALPLVCNRTMDLQMFFDEGEHFLGFDNVDEAEVQVHKLLVDEGLRATIGNAAHEEALAKHTWDIRCQTILERCGLVEHERQPA